MNLQEELKQYKQKYYLNELLKGVLITISLLLSVYMSLNFLEYLGRFSSWIRAIFFYGFVGTLGYVSLQWIFIPLSKLLHLNKQISDTEAALQIGKYFPNIDDKLLNTLQLQAISVENSALLRASIAQRTKELGVVKFTEAIHYEENKKYLRFIFIPLLLLGLIFIISPSLFKELFSKSTQRIINYDKTFAEPAPFTFHWVNKELSAFKNDDYTIQLKMKGNTIPTESFIQIGGRKYKMTKEKDGSFSYLLPKIQKNTKFIFEAAGFGSDSYELEVLERPSLLAFSAKLVYPAYLGKSNETWNNIGNLVVPEGTKIEWEFQTQATQHVSITFGEKDDKQTIDNKSGNNFYFSKIARISENYQVYLKNKHSQNKEEIKYYLNVIPDKYPQISMQGYVDTLTFKTLSVGGNIGDDYGISALKLFYRVKKNNQYGAYQNVNLPFVPEQSLQNFIYQLDLSNLELKAGDEVEYFAQVWDNDGVNGAKSTKTYLTNFKVPTAKDLEKQVENSIANTENQIDKALQKAKQIQNDLQKLEDKLKTKEKLDYQGKKQAEELLKKREELTEEVKKLQEQAEKLKEQQQTFQQQSPELAEKMEKLQELMQQLLDPETKKLYEELQKLLEKNKDNENVLQKLKEIKDKELNLEKELEKTLEMFKQMQIDQKMEQTIQKLDELAEKQEKLAEKTEKSAENDKNQTEEQKNEENKGLEKEQDELNKEFEDIKKDIDELEKMDKELQNPNGLEEKNKELQDEEKEIEKEQQNSKNQINKKENKNASKSQKKAAKKMKEMAEKMSDMNAEMESQQNEENIEDLRAILENLIQLSFDQESLMKEFRGVNLSDPRFTKLAQQQLKLKDDAKVVEDSLYALSKRVMQIESFITRELGNMKKYMNESTESIKLRRLGLATSKQQSAMTSMNNLALMLSEALNQMQQEMQMQSSGGSKGKKKKPQKGSSGMASKSGKGKKGKQPNISQLQKQLGEQIKKLQQSGKTGRQLSEELAKLAAEQQRIREALRQLEKMGKNMGNGTGGNDGNKNGEKRSDAEREAQQKMLQQIKDLQKEMDKIEEDLVNKNLQRISQQRLKEIETRLLESEKAIRERGEEEQRKAETAKEKQKVVPPALQQYFKNKEKQTELLKTIPPALSPYYKKEVDKYFDKIK
jgi:hypothetical protein